MVFCFITNLTLFILKIRSTLLEKRLGPNFMMSSPPRKKVFRDTNGRFTNRLRHPTAGRFIPSSSVAPLSNLQQPNPSPSPSPPPPPPPRPPTPPPLPPSPSPPPEASPSFLYPPYQLYPEDAVDIELPPPMYVLEDVHAPSNQDPPPHRPPRPRLPPYSMTVFDPNIPPVPPSFYFNHFDPQQFANAAASEFPLPPPPPSTTTPSSSNSRPQSPQPGPIQ